jgi:hypothetical protein
MMPLNDHFVSVIHTPGLSGDFVSPILTQSWSLISSFFMDEGIELLNKAALERISPE